MKVIILAAGRGSRLGERTREKPKCLCTLQGKTLLERCLKTLALAGISRSDIGIVTGYRSELIHVDGTTKFHNADWERTNMFVSLTMATEWLMREACIVCYSDIVFTPDLIKKLVDYEASLIVPYYTEYWNLWSARMENPLEDLETFRLDDKGNLTEIGQKPGKRSDIEGQFMGLIRFTPESWSDALETIRHPMPKSVEKLDMTTLLNCMIQRGSLISTFPSSSLWLECDTEEDILYYERSGFLQSI